MFIKELFLDAFGRFNKESISFKPGLNIVAEDNEFGKSTVIEAIRVAFYGYSPFKNYKYLPNLTSKAALRLKAECGGGKEFVLSRENNNGRANSTLSFGGKEKKIENRGGALDELLNLGISINAGVKDDFWFLDADSINEHKRIIENSKSSDISYLEAINFKGPSIEELIEKKKKEMNSIYTNTSTSVAKLNKIRGEMAEITAQIQLYNEREKKLKDRYDSYQSLSVRYESLRKELKALRQEADEAERIGTENLYKFEYRKDRQVLDELERKLAKLPALAEYKKVKRNVDAYENELRHLKIRLKELKERAELSDRTALLNVDYGKAESEARSYNADISRLEIHSFKKDGRILYVVSALALVFALLTVFFRNDGLVSVAMASALFLAMIILVFVFVGLNRNGKRARDAQAEIKNRIIDSYPELKKLEDMAEIIAEFRKIEDGEIKLMRLMSEKRAENLALKEDAEKLEGEVNRLRLTCEKERSLYENMAFLFNEVLGKSEPEEIERLLLEKSSLENAVNKQVLRAEKLAINLDESMLPEKDIEALRDKIRTCEALEADWRTELARLSALSSRSGSDGSSAYSGYTRDELREKKAELAEIERNLIAEYNALEIEVAVLKELAIILKSEMKPEFVRRAGAYFERLAPECKFTLDRKENGDISFVHKELGIVFSHDNLSSGSLAQFVFALKLAFLQDADPEGKFPLIIDDAFMAYDKIRYGRVLELLEEMGEERQILYFMAR